MQKYREQYNESAGTHFPLQQASTPGYSCFAYDLTSFPSQALDYFKPNPRYYIISFVNILICVLKR